MKGNGKGNKPRKQGARTGELRAGGKRRRKSFTVAAAVSVALALAFAGFVALSGRAAECPSEDRFVNNDDGTVTDTLTGLEWAEEDNGSNIDWSNAKRYCEGYGAGGKSGWRMPTYAELQELHRSGAHGSVIKRTGWAVWAQETAGSEAAYFFFFTDGQGGWSHRSNSTVFFRALPVRSGK